MELKWLEDFLSLVDTHNFSRSAETRGSTQPAFSRRIKSLEEWLGVSLFDRQKQPVALTAAGERFRTTAEEVVRRLYQIREDLRLADKAAAATIKFAATHSLSLLFFPNWIAAIEAEYPLPSTRLDSDQIEHGVQSLMRGDCHFLLTYTHPAVDLGLTPAHFASMVVGRDRLIPVAARVEGRSAPQIPGSRAHPVPYLAYAETSAIGRAVEHMLANRAEPPHLQRVFVSHLAAVLKSVVLQGRGVAWLPEALVRDDLASGALVAAGDASWEAPVAIELFRSRSPLPPKSEDFWRRLGQLSQDSGKDTPGASR